MKIPAAFIENDAVGCFDQLVSGFLLLCLRELGFPEAVTKFLGSFCDNTTHHVQTQFDTSDVGYHNTWEKPLYGPGQGPTCGPIFWIICWLIIYATFDPETITAVFQSMCGILKKIIVGISFVDDTGLAVTSAYEQDPGTTITEDITEEVQHLIDFLKQLSWQWEHLLFTTGGTINFQKSFW
jgi:hypothetical protein